MSFTYGQNNTGNLLPDDYKRMISNYDIVNQTNNEYKTDSSLIRVESFYADNVGYIYNELNDTNVAYITKIYLDTKTIETSGKWVNGEDIGSWEFYSRTGTLEQIRDYDRGNWVIVDSSAFKHYQILEQIKRIVDAKVIEKYGNDFFNKYLIWNFSGSGKRNKTEFGRWTDKFENPPNKFEVRYNVINNGLVKETEIVYSVDSVGNEIPRFFIK